MKPIELLATAATPDGGEMTLVRQGEVFSIRVDRQELMTSRAHESELELARIGCARIAERQAPTVLIGGLGMGYTLRQTLDLLQPEATVVLCELMPEVVRWNREFLGGLAGQPLRDRRVKLEICDVMRVIQRSAQAFDAILLDVDNGPEAFTAAGNDRLYSPSGLSACFRALHAKGCLCIWSSSADPGFARMLERRQIAFRCIAVPAYPGARSLSRHIWVLSREPRSLPDTGKPGTRPGGDSASKADEKPRRASVGPDSVARQRKKA